MREHQFMVDKRGEPMVVSADAELPADLTGIDRLLALAQAPALEALQPLLGRNAELPAICVLLALPADRPGRPRDLERGFIREFSTSLAAEVAINTVDCCAYGHAGGLVCLERALRRIRSGESDLCLVGGVESYLEPLTLEWLDSINQLHSESTIWGICPGEGAGFCLLASPTLRDRLDLQSTVELLSAGSAHEANLVRTDTVCIGEGLSEAFGTALARLRSDGAQVDHTICDMTGEPYRGNEYGFAMLRLARRFAGESDFETPADCWGDVGSASGPLFAMLASFAVLKDYAPGPFTLLWASSEDGARAAALLKAAPLTDRRSAELP